MALVSLGAKTPEFLDAWSVTKFLSKIKRLASQEDLC